MSTLDWKRKLAAYLHDPPSKALDIRDHEEHADVAANRFVPLNHEHLQP